MGLAENAHYLEVLDLELDEVTDEGFVNSFFWGGW